MSAPLPWLDAQWARVRQAREGGRLGHALLLAGPAGVGKRHFAQKLASSLLCEAESVTARPCGQCRSCQLDQAEQHPNRVWLRREMNDKGDRERRDITLEQVRAMIDQVSLAGHYGGAKVVVFDPVDALSGNGVNAVLKTIEEPPPQTFLILITERPMALLATLRSRCQRIDFGIPDRAEAVRWLAAQAPDCDGGALLDASGGAPLAALADLQSGAAELRQAWQAELLDVASGRRDPLAAAAQVPREALVPWLDSLLGLLRLCLKVRATGEGEGQLAAVAGAMDPARIEPVIDEVYAARRRLNTNPNPQLLVESLMIAWWHRCRVATSPARSRIAR